MRIARHWVREIVERVDAEGRAQRAVAWGWSTETSEEARQRARTSAERVLAWLAKAGRGDAPPRSAEYTYGLDRPPREEILQELHDAAGEISAFISRNSYGSLVLNCRDLMFVDIDVPPRTSPVAAAGRLFGRLFGKQPPAEPADPPAIARVRAWSDARPDVGMRLYQTAAGYRLALVDRPRRAEVDETRQILAALGSDPLYQRLCETQQCFRARLSPKPWRMQIAQPPARFPFADAATEARYRQWQREYDEAAPQFATCRFLETMGAKAVHAALGPLIDLHDSLAANDAALPLA